MKLIDKDKLIKEIERRKNFWKFGSSIQAVYRKQELDELLDFIDALEVKEIDLEKEEQKKIAKYLYEKKGYPIDLNGNIPSFEETMKDAEQYVRYKKDKFIEMAWDWIENNLLSSNQQDNSRLYFEQFKNYIKGE